MEKKSPTSRAERREISLSQLKVRNNHVTLLITFRWLSFDFLYIQPHQRAATLVTLCSYGKFFLLFLVPFH
jgi:hypothetical protein